MVYRSPFPYLLAALMLPAAVSLVAFYGFGKVFLLPPGFAWAVAAFCGVAYACGQLLTRRALRHPARLEIAFNRITLNGVEFPFDFSVGGAVLADARALGDAIDMALSREMGRWPLKMRTPVDVRVFAGGSGLTLIERSALEQVLAERFLCHQVVEVAPA